MNFAFTDEQAMIAETALGFFTANATSPRTRAAMAADGIDRALWQGFTAELGLGGIALPEAQGGAGLGMVELAILGEAAGATVAALPLLGSIAMAAQAIAIGAGADAQARCLPGLIAGTSIGTAGSSETATVTDGHISGSFDHLPHGASADLFVLSTGTGAWLAHAGAPGLTVTAQTTMDQTRPYAQATLDNTPAEPISAAGWQRALDAGRLVAAAEALGGAQACLDRTCEYAQQRVQFGRQIGSFQAYKHRLADMMIEIEQARSAVWWAACALDEGTDDLGLALHAAKSFATDTYAMCAGNMIQLHGGIGFTWDHDAHLFFKRARALQSMLGSNAWHREQVALNIGLAA